MDDSVFIGWWVFVFLALVIVAFLKAFQASF